MTVTRDAPLDTMPILLRSGGIVPMLDPSVVTLAPATTPGIVSIDDVAGIYDVRAAIDETTGNGSLTLADGTLFATALGSGPVPSPRASPRRPPRPTSRPARRAGSSKPSPAGRRACGSASRE